MAQQSKFAKGPDGTRGFGGAGRGKPIITSGGDTGASFS